jgi:pyruvate dehydrogenase E2 component (dihydrolipoamide acetyltransferase)
MSRGSPVRGWRRIASAMWRPPDDPQIYGALDIDAREIVAYLERARAAGHRVTPTHLVGRAVAHAIAEVPDLNVQLRRGRVRARPTIDVFFITAVDRGRDLSGVKIVDVPAKPATVIAEELTTRRDALRRGEDRDFARTKRAMDGLPSWLLRPALRLTAFATEDLGVEIPSLGLRPHPFGSAMVTSVGMFGIPHGFAPLAWMYDVPLLVLVGELCTRPAVVDGQVVAATILPITATIDHRYVDGSHVSRAMTAFRAYLEHPAAHEPTDFVPARASQRAVS